MTIINHIESFGARARDLAKAFRAAQTKADHLKGALQKVCDDYKAQLELDYTEGDTVVLKEPDCIVFQQVMQCKEIEVRWRDNEFEVSAVVKVPGIKTQQRFRAQELEKHVPGRIRF